MSSDRKELQHILEALEFTPDQINVYLASLALGPRPISIIAKEVKFRRSKTYDVVKSLSESGLLEEYTRSGVLHYTAAKPSSLLNMIMRKQTQFSNLSEQLKIILPALEALTSKKISKTKVELWKGDEAVCSLWTERLEHPNSSIYSLLDYKTAWPLGRDNKYELLDHQYTVSRSEKNIQMYSICNRSPESDEAFLDRKKWKRNMKVISGFQFKFEFAIHEGTILIICNHEEVSGIVIRDAILADTLQAFFKAIWNSLPDYSLELYPVEGTVEKSLIHKAV